MCGLSVLISLGFTVPKTIRVTSVTMNTRNFFFSLATFFFSYETMKIKTTYNPLKTCYPHGIEFKQKITNNL